MEAHTGLLVEVLVEVPAGFLVEVPAGFLVERELHPVVEVTQMKAVGAAGD